MVLVLIRSTFRFSVRRTGIAVFDSFGVIFLPMALFNGTYRQGLVPENGRQSFKKSVGRETVERASLARPWRAGRRREIIWSQVQRSIASKGRKIRKVDCAITWDDKSRITRYRA